MSLEFPEFGDELLQRFSVCARFNVDSGSRLDGLPERTLSKTAHGGLGNSFSAWLAVDVDATNSYAHAHFDFERVSGPEKATTENFVLKSNDEIGALIAPFFGQAATIELSGEYLVPFDALPEHGIIATLRGVGTESCGSSMLLDGASMAIDGDLFYKLKWNFDYESDSVCASLFATSESAISDKYLVELADLMRSGLNCFVFEDPDSGTGIDHDRSSGEEGVRRAAP